MACEATEVWLNGLRRGAGGLPLPSPQVLATVLQSLREEELAWLERLASCLGAAVALARERQQPQTEVRGRAQGRWERCLRAALEGFIRPLVVCNQWLSVWHKHAPIPSGSHRLCVLCGGFP
jgi:hypothetical protein